MPVRDKPIPEETDVGNVHTGSALSNAGELPQQHFSNAADFISFGEKEASEIVSGLEQGANAVDRENQRTDKMWALAQASAGKTFWNTKLKEQYVNKQEYDTPKLMQDYHDYVKKVVGNAPSGRAADMALQHFEALAPQYARQSVMANAHARVGGSNDFLNKLIEGLRGDSSSNPDLPNVKNNLTLGAVAVRDSNADLPTKANGQAVLDNVAHDAAWNDASADPIAGVDKIDNGHYDGLVNKETLDGWKPKLLALASQNAQEARVGADQMYLSALHSAKFNGPKEDQPAMVHSLALAEAAGSSTAASGIKKYNEFVAKANEDFAYANAFYKAQAPLPSMREDQMDAYVSSLKPANDDPDYTRKNKLYDEIFAYSFGNGKDSAAKGKGFGKNEGFDYPGLVHERAEDPFGYGLKYSDSLAKQSAQLADMAKQITSDPVNGEKVLPQLQAAQSKLIQDSMTYQATLGIPLNEMQVMSKEDAENYSSKLQNAGDVKQVMQAVNEIRTRYGGYYPQAIKSMQQLPDDKSRLGGGYSLLLANADNPMLSQKLSLALARPKVDMDALIKNAQGYGGLESGESTISVTLNSIPEFKAWKENQFVLGGYSPKTEHYVNDIAGAMQKLTAQYIAEGSGITDAARRAGTEIFSNNYVAVRTDGTWHGGGTDIIAAKKDEMGKPYNEGFLNDLHNILDTKKAALFAGKDPSMDLSRYQGIPPKAIENNSRWVSMPDNQGAYLLYTAPGFMPEPVVGKDGKPLAVRFSDLQKNQQPTSWQKFSRMVTPERIAREIAQFGNDIATRSDPFSQ